MLSIKNLRKLETLYCNKYRVNSITTHGPYRRKSDNRKTLLVVCGKIRVHKLYAKFKLEIKLGRILSSEETVDHIDENRLNDRFNNLQLLTRKANLHKAILSGTITADKIIHYSKSKKGRLAHAAKARGELNINSKLNDNLVLKIRQKRLSISEKKKLASELGCGIRSITNALSGATYKHLKGGTFNEKVGRPKSEKWLKLSPKINKLRSKGFSYSSIAKKLTANGIKCCTKQLTTLRDQGLIR